MSTAQPRLKRERKRSREIFERAEKVLVGGVNSPVRAFRSVGGEPLIIERGSGQYLYDADGNELLDFVCSWGAMILGHANPAISEAIAEQARRGTSFGVTTELELELATLITQAIPLIEKIRFVSSGTEATMSAVRLARGVTKRDFLVKFEGCYHGHADSFLSQGGSGLATLGIAECPGVPQALAALTLNVPYNDLNAVERVFSQHKGKIAAIIVEPIAANMGVVPPDTGFLRGLQEISRRNGALLIADEVITGFRFHNGSAQELLGIEADLTTLGKIIGGGVPVAAYGGRAELMNNVAARSRVSSGVSGGKPPGYASWYCDTQTTEQTRTLRRDDAAGAAAGLWPSCRAVGGGDSGADQCYRLSLDDFPCTGTGEELRGCQTLRHETVCEILPRDAGSWHLPGPITV